MTRLILPVFFLSGLFAACAGRESGPPAGGGSPDDVGATMGEEHDKGAGAGGAAGNEGETVYRGPGDGVPSRDAKVPAAGGPTTPATPGPAGPATPRAGRPLLESLSSQDFYMGRRVRKMALGRQQDPQDPQTGDSYAGIQENGFFAAAGTPLSTFAADVDTASWANIRRFISEGSLPPAGAVRIEEMVNALEYGDAAPTGRDGFAVTAETGPCPWNDGHRLLRLAVRTREIPKDKLPPCNLVFLLDVSGSMQSSDKLSLIVRAMDLLVDQLRLQDRVAIVTYAGHDGVALESTPGDQKDVIRAVLHSLTSGGSTAGAAGITKAYEIARAQKIPEGVNRVILGTDGDFNVGISSVEQLEVFIEEQRNDGIFLSVLGVGRGNLKDDVMEALADTGNGNYSYLDDLNEARRVLVAEFGATLVTVAKDVKLQMDWDPEVVSEYRLIGYENRVMAAEDFRNDKKDAGEMGSGHHVTVLYEYAPVAGGGQQLGTLRIRSKPPLGDTAREKAWPVLAGGGTGSRDMDRATAVAAFGMVLRGSKHCGAFGWQALEACAAKADDQQVLELVRKGMALAEK